MRLHLGLLTASLVLCAVHAGRHMSATAQSRAAFASITAESASVSAPREMGPTINWGGQKR